MDYSEAARKEGQVSTLNELEHIYKNSDMYIASLVQSQMMVWTLNEQLVPKLLCTKIPLGLIQLFSELLANACDAMEKTVRNGFEIGPIEVEFNNPYITIRNEGFPILVVQDEEGKWGPEKVITTPRTGSNFGSHRHGGGKNGFGFTLVYAFTDYLRVVVHDSVNQRSYNQVFYGPTKKTEPVIEDYDGTVSTVEITFKPDLSYFNYEEGVEEYPPEVEDLYRNHLAVASLACKIPAFFNGSEMNYSSIIDYSNLFFASDLRRKVHYLWPKKTKVIVNDDGSQVAEDGLTLPLVELIVVDSDAGSKDAAKQFGITNSILNHEGGVHVDSVFEALARPIIAHINGEKKPKAENAKSLFRINLGHIKLHMGVIISVRVVNPLFNGQSKTALKSFEDERKPGSQATQMNLCIPPSFVEEIIEEFQFIASLRETMEANALRPLTALNGKKTLRCCRDLKQGEDCNLAGGKDSQKCTLLIFEGKSAGAYGSCFRAEDPNGIDRIGLLATGGKIKNIFGITPDTIAKLSRNKFFQDFKTMTNIRENTDYTIPENRAQLRYGRILYAGDADVDGIHICALFFNLINTLYPSLFEAGVIATYRTKIISAIPKRGKNRQNRRKLFYQLSEYHEWESKTDLSKWDIQYFKGLGSSDAEDVKEDYKTMFVVETVYDEDADHYIRLFFDQNKEMAAKRRELIVAHDKNELLPPIPIENGIRLEKISDYLQHSYITYCAHTLVRHLVARDGLTEVRRKIIHAATKRWNWWSSVITTPLRVSVFNGAAIDITSYHHGDSLTSVIIRMSQNFVGSNNIPYFIGKGQFGSRETGSGVHAAARYISITPNYWWLKLMYNPKDLPLLTYKHEEGQDIEPEFYLPRLPMTLVQGQNAVMSGWSTYIPPYHVLDLCDWYVLRLSGRTPDELEEPLPYFRGFLGKVEITDTRALMDAEESVFDEDGREVIDDDGNVQKMYAPIMKGKRTLNTYGIVTDISKGGLTITELPVGIWTNNFCEKTLTRKQTEGKIKKFSKIPGYKPERPKIRVEGVRSRHYKENPNRVEIDADDFSLRMSYPLDSMWILDSDEKAKYFSTVTDILEDYYQWRLPFYEKRRLLELKAAKKELKDILAKVEYIKAVIQKKLIIIKRSKADILANIQELGLRADLYGFTKYYDNEAVQQLLKKQEQVKFEFDRIKKTTDKDIMLSEIVECMDEYKKVYGDDRP
jgi:DNA topoisomerase-2